MAEKVTEQTHSTQQFVEVQEVKDGVVVLKSGGLRAVIMVAGVNFELKSESEQDVITTAYQDFLNMLDFSVQIVVHSRKLNIDRYLKKMQDIREKEPTELLRNQIDEYIQFIKGFVKDNEIMTKHFFVVVPYEAGGMGQVRKGVGSILSFGKKKQQAAQTAAQQETFEQKIVQLRQRIDQILGGFERIGLRAVTLNDQELVELFYNLYNPETVERELKLEGQGTIAAQQK
jgi:type IV secretory pathway VirB4 component